jgi:hypothetical protein
MPRPPPDLTQDAGTPTDSVTPTDAVPAPLPRPPTPPAGTRPPRARSDGDAVPRPPRLPRDGGARPGRRGETPSDLVMTARIPRLPGSDQTPAPLPPSPGARDAERWFEQVPTNPAHLAERADSTGAHAKLRRSSSRLVETSPVPLAQRAWLLPTLIAAIALTIGMILGGLLFGGSDRACEPCDPPADRGHGPKQ